MWIREPRGLHLEKEDLAGGRRRQRREVAVVEVAIAPDARVHHPPVERRADLQAARPVLGGDLQLDRRQVGQRHVHQAPFPDPRRAPLTVAKANLAGQHAALQVQLLAKRQDFDSAQIEPLPVAEAKGERKPVGSVDQILVLHRAPGDLGGEPIVATRHVGAGIVNLVGDRLGRRAAGGEVAVAERAQRLAQRLALGNESIVDERPGGHPPAVSAAAARSSRKRRTSSVSRSR
jgi:hypothetical protein